MAYEQLKQERKNLAERIERLENDLKSFPEGELLCAKNGKYTKWYKSNGAHPLYMKRSQSRLAEVLAAKRYFTFELKESQQKLKLLEGYLNGYHKIKWRSSEMLEESSGYRELLNSYFQTDISVKMNDCNNLEKWIREDFRKNENYAEHLIYKTLKDHYVRSKSEVIIANALQLEKIPYRYECALELGDSVFYPDFTILHPMTGQIFYWEHFGMMDHESYCEKAFNKLKIYGMHGVVPSVNLITTYETKDHPIDSDKIRQMVREYFM